MEQLQKDIDYIKGEAKIAKARAERIKAKIKNDGSLEDAVNQMKFNVTSSIVRELAYKLGVLVLELDAATPEGNNE